MCLRNILRHSHQFPVMLLLMTQLIVYGGIPVAVSTHIKYAFDAEAGFEKYNPCHDEMLTEL